MKFNFKAKGQTKEQMTGKLSKRILSILSWYPFIWTIAILIYGLLKSHFLMMSHVLIVCIMSTWVVFIYGGILAWLFLIFYLPLKKKITLQQCIIYILILVIGTIVGFYAVEYDIFSSGVKYMD